MVGSSVYGSKKAAVPAPIEPSERILIAPMRIQSSPSPERTPASMRDFIAPTGRQTLMRVSRPPSARIC